MARHRKKRRKYHHEKIETKPKKGSSRKANTDKLKTLWCPGVQIPVLFLFFLSGFSGLVYQVVWIRMLMLIFGVTSFAVSTVVAAFMAGLSIGSYTFGRIVEKSKHPLKLYTLLEIGIGIYGFLSPSIFSFLDSIYSQIYQSFSPNYTIFSLIRFVLAFIFLLIPTFLMGGTLPVLIKFFIRKREQVGGIAGYLYGLNTFGAVVGTFGSGFFFIKYLGVQNTIFLAAGMNCFIGLISLLLWRASQRIFQTATEVVGIKEEPDVSARKSHSRISRLLLWGFGFSGMASLAYEILWTRSLLYFLGLTTYTFTTILTTFLIGLTLGSLIFSRFVDRRKDLLSWFGWIEILLGISALAVIPLIGYLYQISTTIREWVGYYTWWGNVGIRFILSFLLILLPTFLMGATFPVVVKCYSRNIRTIGKKVGEIYSVNTIGSIIGSFIAGFLLIPLFGVRFSISLIVLINLALGMVVFYFHPEIGRSKKIFAWSVCIVVLVILFLTTNQTPLILSSVEFKGPSKRYELLYYKEGIDGSIAVLEDRITGERELNINGESTAFTIYQDMQVHKLLGHLPLLIHSDPKTSLIIGFGFGSTSLATMYYPQMQTDCVELVRDEVETAQYFINENHHVLEQPRFHLIIDDGRDYIKGTDRKYDMISFNAIHPKISPNLYTLDFYRMCKHILTEEGIIIAWLPPNAMTENEYQSLIKTFLMVFPHCSLWYVNPSHTLLMATPKPLRIDFQRLMRKMGWEGVKNDLKAVNLDDPYELLSCFLLAEEDLIQHAKYAPINSDDLPYIEFSREMVVTVNLEAMNNLLNQRKSIYPYLINVGEDSIGIQARLNQTIETKRLVARGQTLAWIGRYDEAKHHYIQALDIQPDNLNAKYLLGLIARRKEELKALIQLNPQNDKPYQALGEIYLKENNFQDGYRCFQRAIAINPRYTEAHHHLGVIYFLNKKLDRALDSFIKAVRYNSKYGASYYYLGLCYWQMGDLNQSLENFKKSIQIDPEVAQAHFYLALAYQRKGLHNKVLQELQITLALDPEHQSAYNMLNQMMKPVKNR